MGERKEKAGVDRFEDFLAWQEARILNRQIYACTRSGTFSKDFGLRDQIRRASVSIMSNIAEGFERNRPTEFHQFLSIAKSSCAEVRSHLYAALDAGYVDETAFSSLSNQAERVGRLVGALRASVQERRDAL